MGSYINPDIDYENEDPWRVGLDDGSGCCTLIAFRDGQVVTHTMPSLIQDKQAIVGGEYGWGNYTTEEGGQFYVSRNIADPVATTSQAYQTSQANRCLIIHALMEAGLGGQHIILCVGLPLSQYFTLGAEDPINRKLVDQKKENIRKGVTIHSGSLPIITEVNVMAEAYSAFMMIKEGLNLVDYYNTIIFDIGEYTVNIAELTPDYGVVKTKTSEHGMFVLKDRVQQTLVREYGIPKCNSAMADRAIREKKIVYGGKEIDVSEEIDNDIDWYATKLIQLLKSFVDSPGAVNTVFIGGGSICTKDFIDEKYREVDGVATFVDDPETINVNAFFMRLLERDNIEFMIPDDEEEADQLTDNIEMHA